VAADIVALANALPITPLQPTSGAGATDQSEAISHGDPGIYNVVDDEPTPVSTWLPALADAVGAKPPHKGPAWLGTLVIGDGGVSMMTKIRGATPATAHRSSHRRRTRRERV
jgi:hypothetical protein